MADDVAAPPAAAGASAVVLTAIYLHGNCQPEYPDEARRAGVTGVTRIKVTIDATGQVTRTEVVQSSGTSMLNRRLDRIAAAAVKRCPVRVGHDENGQPVGAEVVATYNWP